MATKKTEKPAIKEKKSEIKKETKLPLKKTVAKEIVEPKAKKIVSKSISIAQPIKSATILAVKSNPKKELETSKNKKAVKKAPNQSLETILPEDKKEIKPKELAKPPVRRDLAPKPLAINLKKEDVEKTNYSQAELEEFKGIIHKKLEEAKRDFDLLKESLSNKDNGTEDTSPTFKLLEDGSDVLSKEELAQLASRQQKFITSLENALIRIQNKTYGVCRVTGKLISADRLRIVPHATTSIEGKMAQ